LTSPAFIASQARNEALSSMNIHKSMRLISQMKQESKQERKDGATSRWKFKDSEE
jgi:hypothetical protein